MDVEGKNNVPSVIAAAHELKSPLSLIRQLSLILEDESLTADQRSVSVNRIYLTTQKALRLTSDLTRAYNLNDPTLFFGYSVSLKKSSKLINSMRHIF